jgi:hypothetical protein
MDGESGDGSVRPPAISVADPYGLSRMQFVEERKASELWKSLQAQVAVVGDLADDEAGFIHWGHEQAMWRTLADRHLDGTQAVGRWGKTLQAFSDPACDGAFISRDGRLVHECLQVMRKIAGNAAVLSVNDRY